MSAIDYYFTTEPWVRQAACAKVPNADKIFFPGQGESITEAKAICAGCPVREECLDYALRTTQRFGIWGGVTERQRRTMRVSLRRAAGHGLRGPIRAA